ncbi:MAG TPA: hypothetical protein VHU84_03465 [Lacipirellulaceae bacterium]|jgi:hypothetical protein|nr:hypothetical protein [Lacipirellulaceae bacterium]
MKKTSQVIDDLYRVLSPYRIGDEISGCVDCVPAEDSHVLVDKPRASLSVEDLDRYAFKAMTTWGNETDFKYFLPRLLELVLLERLDRFSMPETLFGKLRYGDWTNWPGSERRAIEHFLDAFWLAELQRPVISQDDDSIDTAICALGQACDDVGRFLMAWSTSSDALAARQLAQFVWINADRVLRKNRLMNSFWDGRPGIAQVLAWLKSDAVASVIHEHSSEYTEHLKYASAQLDAIRATVMPSKHT